METAKPYLCHGNLRCGESHSLPIHIWLIAAVVAFCVLAAPVGAEDEPPEYVAVQISRYVKDDNGRESWEEFSEALQRNRLEYNEYFRHPTLPEGPTPVDCEKAERIGVLYAIIGPKRKRGKTVRVRFVWKNDSLAISNKKLDHFQGVTVLPPRSGRFAQFHAKSLSLSHRYKVNGVYTLTAYLKGEKLFENSFDLAGCENAKSVKDKWNDFKKDWRELQERENPKNEVPPKKVVPVEDRPFY